jgi:hypothetical protein
MELYERHERFVENLETLISITSDKSLKYQFESLLLRYYTALGQHKTWHILPHYENEFRELMKKEFKND